MDPNETLRKLISLATHIVNADANIGTEYSAHAAVDLAQAVLDIDGWLRNGGFLPVDWAAGRRKWEGR